MFIIWDMREQKTLRSSGGLYIYSLGFITIPFCISHSCTHPHLLTPSGSMQQQLFWGSLTLLGEISVAVYGGIIWSLCRRSPFSCAWSLRAGRCSSLWKSMRWGEIEMMDTERRESAAQKVPPSPPPNCLATVFQGLSFEIKSLVDWRLRFGEIELVPFDKTAEKWALSSTSFVPSLPFLHPLFSLSPSLSLSVSLLLTPPPTPPNPFPTRMIMLLSTAWCIQFTRLFSVISVNWILSITYRCFHICIKVRVVKSVKLQFRQCHSNKYTGLFLSLSLPSLLALRRWVFTDSVWI